MFARRKNYSNANSLSKATKCHGINIVFWNVWPEMSWTQKESNFYWDPLWTKSFPTLSLHCLAQAAAAALAQTKNMDECKTTKNKKISKWGEKTGLNRFRCQIKYHHLPEENNWTWKNNISCFLSRVFHAYNGMILAWHTNLVTNILLHLT